MLLFCERRTLKMETLHNEELQLLDKLTELLQQLSSEERKQIFVLMMNLLCKQNTTDC